MSKVYLSGPMTGLPDLNFSAFETAARALREKGVDVVSPAELNPDSNENWETCMRADIAALMACDTLVLLPGWESSKGAHLELHVAHRVGIRVCKLLDFYKEVHETVERRSDTFSVALSNALITTVM